MTNTICNYEQILQGAEKFNYPVEEWETADGGYAITVYQGEYYKIHYYFNKNKNYESCEVEEI
jgi:hypothetical protein